MANINSIEREHKKIFNELSLEEKKAFYKQLSETKFSNYPFLTKEGTLIGDLNKCNDLDNLTVKINENPNLNETVFNASLSVIYDYEALKKKYNEEILVAFSFYYERLSFNLTIIENLIYFLESFLGAYEEEPSELLFYVLQDVAKATVGTFNKAIVIVNDVLTNISELAEEEEPIEELPILKVEVEENKAKYSELLKTIMNLDLPEGAVNSG